MDNKKEWTIMVYMAGDNNLSLDMAYTIQQIKTFVKYNDNINLFVYYDGYSPAIPTLYCDLTGDDNCPYFRSKAIKSKLYPPKKEEENENSANAYSVINFVDWCVNKVEYKKGDKIFHGRKADRYAFIFSGHTSGFHSIGLLRDEKSNFYMTMPKINWLLERITKTKEELEKDLRYDQEYRKRRDLVELTDNEIVQETTEILGQKFSFLGFDSCVMGMYEVGYQFKSVAETMVASQGSIPNAGWTYTQLLGSLAKSDTSKKITEIARDFVVGFISTQDSYTIGGVTVDLAAWDLLHLDKLEEPFKNLVDNLIKCFESETSLTYKQMRRALLQVHWNCQSYMFEQNIDLSDFCWLLKNELKSLSEELGDLSDPKYPVMIQLCDEIIKSVRECIILSGFSGGTYQYSNGIALFFPWSVEGYQVSKADYEELLFIKNTEAGKKWVEFLKLYLGKVTLRTGKMPTSLPTSSPSDAAKSITGSLPVNDIAISTNDDEQVSYLSYIYKNEKIFVNELNQTDGKISDDDETRITVNAENRTTVNAENRTTVNAENRTTVNAENRTTVNAENRTPVNAENRTTVNAENRMFSNLNLFFQELFRFKNVETKWNISGFSKRLPARPIFSEGELSEETIKALREGDITNWSLEDMINKNLRGNSTKNGDDE